MRLDAVVPLALADLDRFQILRASIEKFWACEGVINVVVRDQDEAAIAAVVGDDNRYHVLRESTIVPILVERGPGGGWYKQQLIKLAFAAFTTSDFYLTLDADCFLVRTIVPDDLVVEGRGAVEYVPTSNFPEWYDASVRLLGLQKRPEKSVSVTPFLYNVRLVGDLIERLKGLTSTGQWERLLLERPGWAEHTLYHANAEDRGLWPVFHSPHHPIHGNCIWNREDSRHWDASRSFQAPTFMFSVVQSNTGLPASWTWERVKPYLGASAVRTGPRGS
jgi:hypothetical protein